jgi:plasmid stability protein
MAKTFEITLPDDLEQALTVQAKRLNKSPEETMLELLSQQLTNPSEIEGIQQTETDPLLKLIGSISVDIPDLAENHDYYIGQALTNFVLP